MFKDRSAVIFLASCAYTCLVAFFLTSSVAAQEGRDLKPPETWLEQSATGPWVAVIEFKDQEALSSLEQKVDVWAIHFGGNTLEALVYQSEYQQLVSEGFKLHLELEKTKELKNLGVALPFQGGGIPGFPCYRTVGETLTSAAGLAAARPELATWIDIGDSWEKTQDPNDGWDLRVLKLTQSAIAGPKPAFFASFAIHAREYATAELGTRFAEFLINNYGTNPDVTWLLDFHEVHLLLQANPDGRSQAETGLFWRKNANNAYCSNTNDRGVDLNRNFDFQWNCCNGSSGQQCAAIYRGPLAASEPEIESHQTYVRSIFPDQRGPAIEDPAPADATGVAIDVHAFGNLVLWPWGFVNNQTGNGAAFATFGRKISFFNGYRPTQITGLTIADGSSADFYYGELGIAGMAFEIGTSFFQSCDFFENSLLDVNIEALLYAAKSARAPFLLPAGPEALNAVVSESSVSEGTSVLLTATVDDTRFNQSNGTEPTQSIASAEAFLDVPPWDAAAVPLAMVASDGTFDEGEEGVEVTVDTTGLSDGRHILYVRGIDTTGQDGVVTAVFLDVEAGLFADGFESGNTSVWSASLP